jgi:hypothetical protein
MVPAGQLKVAHFSKFEVQTLFYIFYAMPKDAAQVRVPVQNIRLSSRALGREKCLSQKPPIPAANA